MSHFPIPGFTTMDLQGKLHTLTYTYIHVCVCVCLFIYKCSLAKTAFSEILIRAIGFKFPNLENKVIYSPIYN